MWLWLFLGTIFMLLISPSVVDNSCGEQFVELASLWVAAPLGRARLPATLGIGKRFQEFRFPPAVLCLASRKPLGLRRLNSATMHAPLGGSPARFQDTQRALSTDKNAFSGGEIFPCVLGLTKSRLWKDGHADSDLSENTCLRFVCDSLLLLVL